MQFRERIEFKKAAFIQVRRKDTIADVDAEKCAMTSHRYGEITGRYVIYRGLCDFNW